MSENRKTEKIALSESRSVAKVEFAIFCRFFAFKRIQFIRAENAGGKSYSPHHILIPIVIHFPPLMFKSALLIALGQPQSNSISNHRLNKKSFI